MVFPKSTVHVSRLAGTALKSFTHGYAQTVVAASQSSYASQNTPVAPLASNFLSRFKDKPKSSQHVHFVTAAAGHQAGDPAAAKQDGNQDGGLGHYQEAWQRHNKAESREWHHLPLARRIGWKPPTTVPEAPRAGSQHAIAEAESAELAAAAPISEPTKRKRSYSTSAIDNFAKAIQGEESEARAFAQVNQSITDEAIRTRHDSPVDLKFAQEVDNGDHEPERVLVDQYTVELERLHAAQQYAQIPSIFEAMLRNGVATPSQSAYRALLASAVELTHDAHLKVPRVLDIYSDMMSRGVAPDSATVSIIVDTLAERALDAASVSAAISQKTKTYGTFGRLFKLDQLEHKIMAEDQALEIAFKVIASSPVNLSLSAATASALLQACALRAQTMDMLNLLESAAQSNILISSSTFPLMIKALGEAGDLRQAVSVFDHYRNLAIANNSGANTIARIDSDVYTALIAAYGACHNIEGGKRLLAKIDAEEQSIDETRRSRDTILLGAVLPLEVQQGNLDNTYAIVNSMSSKNYPVALQAIVQGFALQGNTLESSKAFDALVEINSDLTTSSAAMLAMYIRAQDVEAGERYWRVLEQSPASQETLELGLLRAVSYMDLGQISRGVKPMRTILADYKQTPQTSVGDKAERVEEGIEIMAKAMISAGPASFSPDVAAELLRMMDEHSMSVKPFIDTALAALSADHISSMTPADLETFLQVQASTLTAGSNADVSAPARFACMLQSAISRSILPEVQTENAIERVLVELGRPDLNQLWSSYRYPTGPTASPVMTSVQSSFASIAPTASTTASSVFDDAFDPYLASTDHKGSVMIADILERSNGRASMILNEAMTKFRNIRRAGRHPRFFAYGKLIQAAAKANQLDTAREIIEMAKQDVPYTPQYRIVSHGWTAILDAMVAACITSGRHDLADMYHQDLLEMGAAPSANTFGLYITSLKETTRTFDEASEAVKIFLRSKSEGVEPSSFLYNALIGKLGKARRIDDCLFYFAEMRSLSVRPTSVTYGTIVNALCRVSDEKFAEEIFEEMESCSNYKPRPAPYHSLMQFFLTTKRDRAKVLSYYERMRAAKIEPTSHTFKLLIDAHASVAPADMPAAEKVLVDMRAEGVQPEAVHHAALIHAKGCVAHDPDGARQLFDAVLADASVRPEACIYQALFESLVAAHRVGECAALVPDMRARGVALTPYITNALIHGWTVERDLSRAREAYELLGRGRREPSTYEAMVRAHLAVEDRAGAEGVVREALSRGYPSAVAGKIAELVAGGGGRL